MERSISEIAMLWQKVLSKLENKLDEKQIFDAWFESSYVNSIRNNTLTIVVNSAVAVTLMQNKYKSLILDTIEEVAGEKCDIYVVEKNNLKDDEPVFEDNSKGKSQYFADAKINKEATFDNFVVGEFNSEAGMASQLVAQNPGSKFNPLFIYSESGLGKTHLMHAIGNYIQKNVKQNAKILYITGEDFVEQYIKFVKGEREAESIKDYVSSFDVLLFDDVQFLANKVKTQEMFFYIYEKMVNNNKQIVITSDKQPKELTGLEDRLVTRFSKGLVVNIKKPDVNTCVEILKKKFVEEGINLDDVDNAVIYFYAEKFSNNIRELEGAFKRLIFFTVQLRGLKRITIDAAVEAVKNMIDVDKMDEQLSGTKIINVTADYYNLAPSQLTGKIRTGEISMARHIAMYLIRYNTDLGLKQIGKLFGGKDHTTVMNAVEKVENELKVNTQVKEAVSELEKRLEIK